MLLQNGRLKAGHKQQALRSKGESGGAFVVISGIVRVAAEGNDGMPFEDTFLGTGPPALPHLPYIPQHLLFGVCHTIPSKP